MKANELRIGNTIQYNVRGQDKTVECVVTAKEIGEIQSGHGFFDYQPMPLTLERLKKFGFVFDNDLDMWTNKDFGIRLRAHSHHIYRFLSPHDNPDGYYFMLGAHVQYVHELQNAWFVLMGSSEELEINES